MVDTGIELNNYDNSGQWYIDILYNGMGMEINMIMVGMVEIQIVQEWN